MDVNTLQTSGHVTPDSVYRTTLYSVNTNSGVQELFVLRPLTIIIFCAKAVKAVRGPRDLTITNGC